MDNLWRHLSITRKMGLGLVVTLIIITAFVFAAFADTFGPTFANVSPTGQIAAGPDRADITMEAADPDGINSTTVKLTINGVNVPVQVTLSQADTKAAIKASNYYFTNISNATITAKDKLGSTSTYSWTFYGSKPLNMGMSTPADGGTVATLYPYISVTATGNGTPVDTSSAVMKLDGSVVAPKATVSGNSLQLAYTPATPLDFGQHQVYLEAKDTVGNFTYKNWSFFINQGAASFDSPAPTTEQNIWNPKLSVNVADVSNL
ncbi:MAG TPA: hypothetical protein VHS59_01900, partial [Bacillota bacterium]|nr:hypothetical protein [Bacillota bacterium]